MKPDKAVVNVNDDLLMQQFGSTKDKNEIIEVLKELFDRQKIKLITELGDDEIKLITQILTISKSKQIPIWQTAAEEYMTLMLSRKRKSRNEIIDAIKGYGERQRGLARLFQGGLGSNRL